MTDRTPTSPATQAAAPPPVSWEEVRAELRTVAGRMQTLLAAVPDPTKHAVGAWNIAETAVHLTHAWGGLPMLARRDLPALRAAVPPSVRDRLGRPSGAMLSSFDELAPWTADAVAAEPERDLARIAATIAERAEYFFSDDFAAEMAADPSPRPWILDGVIVAPATFGCHVLNESLVHGSDIAHASGRPWPIDPHAAACVIRGFLLVVLSQAHSHNPGAGPQFCIDLRLVGDRRVFIVKDDAGMRMEEPSARKVDVHLRVDPVSLLLMIWKRRGIPALVARGRLTLWGPRPFAAFKLLDLIPNV